jgi:K+-sensing histidine kinase KdpD
MGQEASNFLARSSFVCAGVTFGVLLAQACDTFEVNAPYLPFLPGIIVSALLGGFRLGAIATLLSGGSLRFFFIKPCYSLRLPNVSDSLHILLFLGVAFLVCYAIDMLIRSNNALSRDNFVLGHKVVLLLRELRGESREKSFSENH